MKRTPALWIGATITVTTILSMPLLGAQAQARNPAGTPASEPPPTGVSAATVQCGGIVPGTVARVSVPVGGGETTFDSYTESWAVSGSGRFVVFESQAELVPGDANSGYDVYLHDRRLSTISLVAANETGAPPSNGSLDGLVSDNGRFVTFATLDAMLPGDRNEEADVFVRDRRTGRVTLVSRPSKARQSNGPSFTTGLSPSGRYVTFEGWGTNMVPGDTNRRFDAFVRDRVAGATELVSVSTTERQGNGDSAPTTVSADGRYVLFTSAASNLVRRDTNRAPDVFIRDRSKGTTRRVNVAANGSQANATSRDTDMDLDARLVVFTSDATNLVPNDTNEQPDIFVKNLRTGQLHRVNVSSDGAQAVGGSWGGVVSGNGRWVAFTSEAPNLVPGDENTGPDIFLHDLKRRCTMLVTDPVTDGFYAWPAIDNSGSTITFWGGDPTLPSEDQPLWSNVFAWQRS